MRSAMGWTLLMIALSAFNERWLRGLIAASGGCVKELGFGKGGFGRYSRYLDFMKRRHFGIFCLGLAVGATGVVTGLKSAGAQEKEMTANQIQELVRYSHSLQDATLRGKLDFKGGTDVPFSLVLKDGVVAFFFDDPKETVVLRQKKGGYTLTRQTANGNEPVPVSEYSDRVRGTDVLFEDLTMRFLYWPWATLDAEEHRIKTRKCWKLHIRNPKRDGPYSQVWIWVDKQSGGLMKMVAFDWDGYQVKTFEVLSGQKIDGSWVLKDMNVFSYSPKTRKETGKTVLMLRGR